MRIHTGVPHLEQHLHRHQLPLPIRACHTHSPQAALALRTKKPLVKLPPESAILNPKATQKPAGIKPNPTLVSSPNVPRDCCGSTRSSQEASNALSTRTLLASNRAGVPEAIASGKTEPSRR